MGISELRQVPPRPGGTSGRSTALARDLVGRGTISSSDADLARLVQRHCDTSLDRIIVAEGLAGPQDLLAAHARRVRSRSLTARDVADVQPLLVDTPVASLLRHAVLPITDRDGKSALVCSDPDSLAQLRPELPQVLNNARILWAPRQAVQARIADMHRDRLVGIAQARVPEVESCRTWGAMFGPRVMAVTLGLLALVVFVVMFPTFVFGVLAGWAIFTLLVSAVFKTTAFVAQKSAPAAPVEVEHDSGGALLPKVSILVPMFRETEVAHALVARLSRLTYPKCLLDVILVLEEEDEMTRRTLATIDLPPWIRPVVVPDGQPRTKPRAMNYALDFCEGDIIGIFDAEDAPDPDQITQVARRFLQVPKDVVCLQGYLDYYNPRQNWLARCFTIEYASWFRLLMPGMARLGFAIPLGGTTLYFRRDALESLGGWDAHNVTEDADLGFRLARHGFRTEMLGTVTDEEANCRPWAWIKQRSRWLKGYMTTYLVHMRRPRLLYRQLGAWKFLGFQAHFVTALSQFILAPLLWSFWLVMLGLPHPLDPVVARPVMFGLGVMFLAVEAVNLLIYASAVTGPKHRHLLPWTPTMHFYVPLGAIAAYKALYELVLKPFFWDKTTHGLSEKATTVPVDPSRSDGGFDLT